MKRGIKKRVVMAFTLALVAGQLLADMPDPGTWSLSTDGELISIAANEVPLRDLMMAVTEFTPAEVDIDDLPDKNVTIRYTNIYLDDLLAKLNVSFVLTFSREAGDGGYELESAWVSHFDKKAGSAPASSGSPGAALSADLLATGAVQKALGYESLSDVTNDFGVVYRTPFPVQMKVDGRIDEWPEDIPWHEVQHTMGEGVATNDTDASFRFATASDEENLYFAIKVTDDGKVLSREESRDPAHADSLDLLFAGNGDLLKTGKITIKRHHVWRMNKDGETVGSGRQHVGLSGGTKAVIIDKDEGWEMELSVPLASLGVTLEEAREIGFNIGLNDDDDGGERENRIQWNGYQDITTEPQMRPSGMLRFYGMGR